MPNSYKHLSQEEREIIANLLSGGSSLGDIAEAEVSRNRHSTLTTGEISRLINTYNSEEAA